MLGQDDWLVTCFDGLFDRVGFGHEVDVGDRAATIVSVLRSDSCTNVDRIG